ncbi:hypothetical protein RF11_12315 [Thelohanellus kitauei]|uniref:Uncharacterized protein n=1 Tax=Thelohanellus kitauei TaxID=669202 RepID=A0A0C2N9B6_THEKT|nr:hypothetical protein RF11_12315 [Thelohanellus kitauei]
MHDVHGETAEMIKSAIRNTTDKFSLKQNIIYAKFDQLRWPTNFSVLCTFFCSHIEVLKTAPVHFCTNFTSTANAMVSTYGRDVLQGGTLLQAVRLVQYSHLLNNHPYHQSTRGTIPNRHSFAGNPFSAINYPFCDIKVPL